LEPSEAAQLFVERALSAEQILSRLEDRLGLVSTSRTGPARHHTLRAALTWSYDLLDHARLLLVDALAVANNCGERRIATTETRALAGVEISPDNSIEPIRCSARRWRLPLSGGRYAQAGSGCSAPSAGPGPRHEQNGRRCRGGARGRLAPVGVGAQLNVRRHLPTLSSSRRNRATSTD